MGNLSHSFQLEKKSHGEINYFMYEEWYSMRSTSMCCALAG